MAQVTTMHHHHHLSSMRSSSDAERERERLVTLAVAMVENAAQQGTRVSVRTAAKHVGLPKSTVHRYIRARLGVESPRRRSSSGKNGSRSRVSPPKKCGISFILDDPSPVEKFKKLSLSDSPVLQSDSRGPSRPSSGRGNSPFHSHSHGHSSRSPAAHHGYPTLSHHHIQQHPYGVQSNHQAQMPPYRMAHPHYGLE